ncbi:arylamine N-acetyltransferase [Streptomyces sp. NPDC003300]|uniref:arylamine N-acetyltransferase family protein n=1 Tax=unclassified Streptomyces TaxID=2593676 RepID=UPI0033AA13F4
MDSSQADAYLQRIGAERPAVPDAAGLRELHLRHQLAVPFENLSIHLGQDIVLTEPALFEKVVTDRRGGFCYELNGAFGALLRSLGYGVELLAARVYGKDGRVGPPYDHLALRVRTADGETWLADVGFGRHSHFPLRYAERGEQVDPGGVFRIADADADADADAHSDAGDLVVVRDGEPQYLLERRPRLLADFEATCWWQRTSPVSHFRTSLICSRLTPEGRATLSGRTLVLTASGTREERELPDAEAVLAAYRTHFSLDLPREPAVTPPTPPAA